VAGPEGNGSTEYRELAFEVAALGGVAGEGEGPAERSGGLGVPAGPAERVGPGGVEQVVGRQVDLVEGSERRTSFLLARTTKS